MSVSSDEQRLLDAIAADPVSDGPRLAYADWIEPSDPERAEHIRLSCAHAASVTPGVMRFRDRWLTELEDWFAARMCEQGFSSVTFDRGFVTSAAVMSSALVERAGTLFERHPLLRGLTVHPDSSDLAPLAGVAELRRIAGLRVEVVRRKVRSPGGEWMSKLDAVVDDESLAVFIASPHLASLVWLSFHEAGVGPATALAIARSPALRALEGFSITSDSRMNAATATRLATRPRCDALARLTIEDCRLGSEGCAALAASELLANVTELRLTRNGIGDAGAAALANAPAVAALEDLDLTKNLVGDAGARAFAESPYLNRLRRLNLNENHIAEEGAEALAASTRLPALAELGLSFNALYTDEIQEWTDWNGTPVGSGPVPVRYAELVSRYGRRFKIL